MRLKELEAKDVVEMRTGRKIGTIYDLEINEQTMQICSLIVAEMKWMDCLLFFSRPKLKRIAMNEIVCIGKDVVLVKL